MDCTLCGKVALYIADKKAFCGEHKAEAYQRARRVSNRSMAGDTADSSRYVPVARQLAPAGSKKDRRSYNL